MVEIDFRRMTNINSVTYIFILVIFIKEVIIKIIGRTIFLN